MKKFTLLLLCGMIFSANLNAQSWDANAIANYIRTTTANNLTATVNGNTVTVAGTLDGTPSTADYLTFGINTDVTVIWRATLKGTPNNNFSLINISNGSGTFRMESGIIENTGTGRAITNNSTSAINIQGGEIKTGSGNAIYNASSGVITISGSMTKISSANSANSGTIFLANSGTETDDRLIITGGTVENTIGQTSLLVCAISNNSRGSVRVSGGMIRSIGGIAIYSDRGPFFSDKNTVTISGGTVSTEFGTAIQSDGIITISGGTVSATTGTAINVPLSGLITISGNARITSANISSLHGTINLNHPTLNMNGGTIENTAIGTNGNAILIHNGTVNISSGTVRTTSGNAIRSTGSDGASINISGGTISTSGNESVAIHHQRGTLRITGGTISTSQSNNIAINTTSNATVIFGRTTTIIGRIYTHSERFRVLPDTDTNAFAPDSNIYTLEFPTYTASNVAVTDGSGFLGNFTLHNPNWALRESGTNLVMAPARAVAFNLNNAPGTPPDTVRVAQGGTLTSLPTQPTWTGRNFVGWFNTSAQTGGTQLTTSTIINDNITYWARWSLVTYNITYIHNHNNDTTRGTYTIESSSITLPTPSRQDYFFGGWFIDSNLTGTAITSIPTGSTGNRTYWAKWNTTSTIADILKTEQIEIYPNPVVSELRIVIPPDLPTTTIVELFDMNGRRVFSAPVRATLAVAPANNYDNRQQGRPQGSPLRDDTFTINMTPFHPGNYILRIGNCVAKIVKQ